ncbi:hypothetical protein HHK36_022335 [Tetracentron sinense]|uniref:ubiquitinyl hydrolase 1 n=1 Tax=Tetracentron sinense TaxID=13715 RepID=A0A834YRR9_TETSI|nr:hypothetical protein HHK36_022335 [Tetracentron sinense]
MGKKVKRKARSAQRVLSSSLPTIPGQSSPDEIGGDGILIVKDRLSCTHLEKGVDLVKISSKIGSLESVRCEDCRDTGLVRRACKGSKNLKKKGMGAENTQSVSKSIWVCLECGHFGCGGVELPTTPQSHAVRHAKQTRHPCVIQFDNPNLCWCCRCDSLIPVEKSEENGEQKNILWDAMRLIKGQSPEVAPMEVEDGFFGSETKLGNAELKVLNGRVGFVVRGLHNLGNTCFFNSVTQSLLAVDRLRDYFIKLDSSFGPLTMALKKLFFETSLEAGSINVINPETFFGCICAKAPQFRGYQQHDSHELLRCLLDRLCTEELSARKFVFSSGEEGTNSKSSPTFVEATFGGQLSSSVSCVECGHSSIVYEPFLDLSLPVPTKKPPSKNSLPVSRGRKQNVPLKKGGKICPKGKAGAAPILAQCVTGPSESRISSCQVPYSVPVVEKVVASLDESTCLDSNGPGTTYCEIGPIPQNYNISFIQDSVNKKVFQNVAEQTVASVDNFIWLDYIESGTVSDDQNVVSQSNDIPIIQDSGNNQVLPNDDMLQNSSEPYSQVCSLNREPNLEMDSYCGNSCEDELPLLVQGSEVILLPYKEEISTAEEMVRREGEASSSILGCKEGLLDFDGFDNLFNEPEMVSGSNAKSWPGDKNFQVNEVAETGYLATNSIESGPDEVDNTDSPVSVDSCLAYFTKPELLCNEYGWHCESCSKILRAQRMETGKNWPKTTSKTRIKGVVVRSQNALVGLEDDFPYRTDCRDLNSGKVESFSVFTATAESLISDTGRLDDSNRNCTKRENNQTVKERDLELLNPISNCRACHPDISQRELNLGELNNTLQEPSPSSGHYKTCSQASFGDQASDSCSVNEPNNIGCNVDHVQESNSQLLARVRESDDSEGEEIDSNSVKVKRDAIKRMLINRAPPVLTIHLKRFSQDARGRLSKLSGHVDFRDTIDLRPYMEHRCMEGDMCGYCLVGVVEHSGTMRGGHYIAYVRGEKDRGNTKEGSRGYTWYQTSDGSVREVSMEEVLRCEAYILFYEKI